MRTITLPLMTSRDSHVHAAVRKVKFASYRNGLRDDAVANVRPKSFAYGTGGSVSARQIEF